MTWRRANPPVGEGIDQTWLIEWSMEHPLAGPMHNQVFVRLKNDNIAYDEGNQTLVAQALAMDGASPNPDHGAERYRLVEQTTVQHWEEDPNNPGRWVFVDNELVLL